MESELFGHERGAFTGADAPRVGRFELADQGTVLLDEITEIELPLQAKLLRVLQEQSFERVGSSVTQHVDVRVLATTNRDLYTEVKPADSARTCTSAWPWCRIHVPPLRQRREDIPATGGTISSPAPHSGSNSPYRPIHPQRHRPAGQPPLARQRAGTGEHHHAGQRAVRSATRITADQLRPWLIDSPACLLDDADEASAGDTGSRSA